MTTTQVFADRLEAARLGRHTVATLTSAADPLISVEEAYQVAAAGIDRRLAAGETVVGGKLGFTSAAMRQAMGVEHPNYGWLTDAMVIHDGVVRLDTLIHPKIEPEIAFLLGADLVPPVGSMDVLAATAAVMPCLEVVDSRYHDFRFEALDNIADNSSAGLVALGDPMPVDGVDLRTLGVAVWADGRLHATAAGAAALDHPAAAVAWMANHSPRPLVAGHVVISGGLTAPVDLSPGTVVTGDFDRIGSISVRAA